MPERESKSKTNTDISGDEIYILNNTEKTIFSICLYEKIPTFSMMLKSSLIS